MGAQHSGESMREAEPKWTSPSMEMKYREDGGLDVAGGQSEYFAARLAPFGLQVKDFPGTGRGIATLRDRSKGLGERSRSQFVFKLADTKISEKWLLTGRSIFGPIVDSHQSVRSGRCSREAQRPESLIFRGDCFAEK